MAFFCPGFLQLAIYEQLPGRGEDSRKDSQDPAAINTDQYINKCAYQEAKCVNMLIVSPSMFENLKVSDFRCVAYPPRMHSLMDSIGGLSWG